ncbi:MAG: hypothetical protein GQ564_05565 [Bacteroidales bacterium]|nr:hypothetical protein [Bacteroidales bacterium]
MKNIFLNFLIVSMLLIFNSCEEELIIIENEENIIEAEKSFVVVNDVVVFKSLESFSKVMIELHDYNSSELSSWEIENGITKSLRKVQLEGSDEVDNEPKNWLIQDSRFATVINSDGLYAIGDSMHYITNNNEYIYPIGLDVDFTSIKSIDKQVRVFNIIKDKTKSWSDEYFYFNSTSFDIAYSSDYGARRVICHAWSTSYAVYCSNGCELTSQYRSKNFWGTLYWKGSDCDYIKVGAQARYYINGTLYQQYNQDIGYDKSSEDVTVGYNIGTIYTYEMLGTFTFNLRVGYGTYTFDVFWD